MGRKTILIMSRGMRIAKMLSKMASELSREFDVIATIGVSNTRPASEESAVWMENEHLKIVDFPKEMSREIAAHKSCLRDVVPKIEEELHINLYRSASSYLLYRRFNKSYFKSWDGYYDKEDDIIEEFVGSYLALKKIFKDCRPSMIFYETVDFVSTFVALAMSRNRDIFAMGMNFPPCLGHGKVHFTYGTNRQNVLLDFYYKNSRFISRQSYEKADAIIKESKEGRLAEPSYIRIMKDAVHDNFVMSLLRHGYRALPRGSFKYPSQILNLLRKRLWLENHLSRELPPRPYILLFLQMQPEASTTSHTPRWTDYEKIVEQLAINAPHGITIAVKENPRCLGVRGKEYFSQLTDLANVVCLHPSVPTVPLIKNAHAIFTVTGSIGMEGILMGKRVAVLGRPYYSSYSGIRKLDQPEDIFKYLKDPRWKPEEDVDDLRNFLAAYIESVFDLGDVPRDKTRPEPESGGTCLADGLKAVMSIIDKYGLKPSDFDSGEWENK